MARKPSDRTHRHRDPGELNLTSLMDIITTLMFFLLIFANLIPVVIIDSPLPKIASTAEEVRMAKDDENKLEIMLYIDPTGFRVSTDRSKDKIFAKNAQGQYPFDALHTYLVALKKRNPKTKDITLVPDDRTEYLTIIRTMDASRELVRGDAGYEEVPSEIAAKPDELIKFNRLFPDVSLGGV